MLPYQGDLPELSDAEDLPPAESGSDSDDSPFRVPDQDSWPRVMDWVMGIKFSNSIYLEPDPSPRNRKTQTSGISVGVSVYMCVCAQTDLIGEMLVPLAGTLPV